MEEGENYEAEDMIEKWLQDNKGLIHEKSLLMCKEFIENKSEEEILLLIDFEFSDEIHGKIFIHADMISDVLKGSQEFFVDNELFEKAAEARDLLLIIENQ